MKRSVAHEFVQPDAHRRLTRASRSCSRPSAPVAAARGGSGDSLLAVTQKVPARSPASHLAFFVVFTALFTGGVFLTFVAAPLFGLTPLQWGIALVITLSVGLCAAWELRCLLLARRSARHRTRRGAL